MDREPLTVADVLERAADLIEPEGAWTQRANARDEDGIPVPSSDSEATCFCLAGALTRATGGDYHPEWLKPVLPEPPSIFADWLVAFNDSPDRTQAEVVAKLREAAAVARTKGGAA